MVIINHRTIGNKDVIINPTPKQNKYLLSIGAVREYGSDWNGYGYSNKHRVYSLTPTQVREYNALANEKQKKPAKSIDKIEVWAKRLSKLTNITLDNARAIAQEKIEYKEHQIELMQERQSATAPSVMRDKLIKKMERENPLRRIEDSEHAYAILSASRRHTDTNYEAQLDIARELVAVGDIDAVEVKDYARTHYE